MIAWFTRNGVAANLLMFAILGLGVYSAAMRSTLEVFPNPDIDTVSISATLRGATPAEAEEAIVIPIEEAVQDLESIKEIRSTAREGTGSVSVEIDTGFDPREALEDIKSRVDAIQTFPAEVEPPSISLQQRTDSVVKVVLYGDLDEAQMRILADRIQDEILSITAESGLGRTEEITSANLVGVRPYEIAIEVPEGTLLRYDLTLDEVAAAVREQSVDLSGGTIKTAGGEILLRTKSKAYIGEEFEEIVVRSNPDGTRVKVKDLGVVIDAFEETPVEARFNGKPAVLISVNRIGDQNAILISDAVTKYVKARADTLPQGANLTAWRDRSSIVEARLNTLLSSAAWAGILVFLVLSLFLRFSLSLWVVIGIPVAFMGAVICMPFLGATVNIASLFGFILVLGIVVDDAIVTGENVYIKLQKYRDATQAAIDGTKQVALPVTFGILTTIAAFLPLLMIPGFRGAIFRQIPYVVIPVLLFSLIESKLILPAHLKHLRTGHREPKRWNFVSRGQQAVARALEWFVAHVYQPFLEVCLRNRYITAGVFFFMLMTTLGWWHSGRIRFMPFPRVASEYVTASLTMPAGTPYEVTAGHIDRMEKAALALQKKHVDSEGNSIIEHVFASAGGTGAASSGAHRGGVNSGQSNVGEVSFELVSPEDRTIELSGPDLAMEWRKLIGSIPGAEDLNFRAEIGRYGSPLDIQLSGRNPEVLAEASEAVEAELAKYPGLFDIASNMDDGKEEIQLRVKPEAELLGIDANELARQVRGAFFGFESQRIQRGRDDIRVMVRYPRDERESLRNLRDLRIRTANGDRVPFANVAELSFGRSPANIQRIDRRRTVNVVADVNKEEVDLVAIKEELESDKLPRILADYPGVSFTMEGEAREQREANQALKIGCLFVVFIIYCLLAIPFRSYFQPLMVMSVIPFGLIGAVIGHLLMGEPLSFMSLFGMLALSGVVVNDSLVLVDWINNMRREGVPLTEAVRTGGGARFRPIILTSLTTFAGLMPLLTEKSTQAQFLIPMAISLGFGILFATAITLILIPVNYLVLEDIKSAFAKFGRWYARPFREANGEGAAV